METRDVKIAILAIILGIVLFGALSATVFLGDVCDGHEGQAMRGTPKARGNNSINPLIICREQKGTE